MEITGFFSVVKTVSFDCSIFDKLLSVHIFEQTGRYFYAPVSKLVTFQQRDEDARQRQARTV